MATNGFLSLQTREGCKRWLAILLAAVLVFSCIAQLLSSAGNRIKVESVTFDMRGAEINGDLYYPAGVTDEEKYPAVILAPGAGVVKENLRGLAEELAHRNYVVLNVNPYGNGLSETPVYNENDMGPNQFNIFGTPLGVLDAVNFVRTMEFVDHTRIGLSGHSQGSRRTGYAALMDCGYYTFNDVLLILHLDVLRLAVNEIPSPGGRFFQTADTDRAQIVRRQILLYRFLFFCHIFLLLLCCGYRTCYTFFSVLNHIKIILESILEINFNS